MNLLQDVSEVFSAMTKCEYLSEFQEELADYKQKLNKQFPYAALFRDEADLRRQEEEAKAHRATNNNSTSNTSNNINEMMDDMTIQQEETN